MRGDDPGFELAARVIESLQTSDTPTVNHRGWLAFGGADPGDTSELERAWALGLETRKFEPVHDAIRESGGGVGHRALDGLASFLGGEVVRAFEELPREFLEANPEARFYVARALYADLHFARAVDEILKYLAATSG